VLPNTQINANHADAPTVALISTHSPENANKAFELRYHSIGLHDFFIYYSWWNQLSGSQEYVTDCINFFESFA